MKSRFHSKGNLEGKNVTWEQADDRGQVGNERSKRYKIQGARTYTISTAEAVVQPCREI